MKKLKCYKVRRLRWERSRLRGIKKMLDQAYDDTVSKHGRGMTRERIEGEPSMRAAPEDGPAWAVRQ